MGPRPLDIPMRHRELFTKVRSLVVNNPAAFLRAGRALDSVWSYEAIKQREQAINDSLLHLDPNDPEGERLAKARARHESHIASKLQIPGYENAKVVEIQKASRPFACLYEFMQTYIRDSHRRRDPFDLDSLPRKKAMLHAKMILLVAWLGSDASAHERFTATTVLEATSFEADNYLGRSWLSFLFLEHDKERRDEWTDLVNSAIKLIEPTVGGACNTSFEVQVDLLVLLQMTVVSVTRPSAGPRAVEAEDQPSGQQAPPSKAKQEAMTEMPAQNNAFYQGDSGLWVVSFEGVTKRIPNSKGMGIIHTLLRAPGRTVDAVRLSPPPAEAMAHATELDPRMHPDQKVPVPPVEDGQEVTDDLYRQQVVSEIEHFKTKAKEAGESGDMPGEERWQGKAEELEGYLKRSTGLMGRERRLGSDIDRARLRVGKNIKKALVGIRRAHPGLADHLERWIMNPSGSSPSYDPGEETSWVLERPE